MSCICHDESVEDQTFEYLIGPKTSAIPEEEKKIYKQASLCTVWAEEHEKELPPEKDDKDQLFIPMTNFPKVLFRQSYRQWKAGMDMVCKLSEIKKKKIIYIQPLEDFPDFIHEFRLGQDVGFLQFLQSVCEIFFLGFEIKLLPPLYFEASGWKITTRVHQKTKQKQLLVTDIEKNLKKMIPKEGYCVAGISWTDLYPKEGLNFCLGDAHAGYSSAVFCFGRFEPKKFKEGEEPPPTIEKLDGALIWRMIKVVTHEICHILGLAHCFFFRCAMNESNSLEEAASHPFFLCPVCLRKIQKMAKFSLKECYLKLLTLFQLLSAENNDPCFTESVTWLKSVLSRFE